MANLDCKTADAAPADGDSRMNSIRAGVPATWYVAHTKLRQEFRARDQLERQGFKCLLPLVRIERLRRRIRQWTDEPMFSRYLFVSQGAATGWSALRSTRGVLRLVEFGGRPARLPSTWLERFLASERRPVRIFQPGDRVRVADGPFSGLEGMVQLADGNSRAIVLLELLGATCRGSFPLWALKRAA